MKGWLEVKRKQALGKAFEGYAAVIFESARAFQDFSKAAYSSRKNEGITRESVSAVQRRRKNRRKK